MFIFAILMWWLKVTVVFTDGHASDSVFTMRGSEKVVDSTITISLIYKKL
jgi:hypothetical protein